MNKHLETLKTYQAWRRDDTKEPQSMDELGLSPKGIGEALDWAISECENAIRLKVQLGLIKLSHADIRNQEDSGAIDNLYRIIQQTPTQSLAELRAEAVERYGESIGNSLMGFEKCPRWKYAAAIRQEAE